MEIRNEPSSSETRLVWFAQNLTKKENKKKFIKKNYSNDSYNAKLFYWQRHQRLAYHNIEIAFTKKKKVDFFEKLSKQVLGLCHCYDCWSEVTVCHEFLKLTDPEYIDAIEQINKKIVISKLSNLMNNYSKGSHSTLDISPHNLLVNERDTNKRIELAEKTTIKYVNKTITNTDANYNRTIDKK